MAIEGLQEGLLTMEEYATLIWAGLVHEDKDLTPDKVIDLIDEHSSLVDVTRDMWKALNETFTVEGEEKGKKQVGDGESEPFTIKRAKKLAISIGIPISEFWEMTPAELNLSAEIYMEKKKNKKNRT